MIAMLHRLTALIIKELTQFTRDRILFVSSLVIPLLQIILLGNAISVDIQNIPVAVVDYDVSPLSREIITALDNTTELTLDYYPGSLGEARTLMDNNIVTGIVVIPRNFMADSRSTTITPQIQVILDGSHSFVAGRALAAATGAVQDLIEDALVVSSASEIGGIKILSEALYNATLDFRPDGVTSQLALIVFQITALVAVMGIVRERDIGTMEMLTITPLKRLELIAGKAITPLIIGSINFLFMFIIARTVFDVPMRGAFALLYGMTLFYLLCEIGFGLTLSTLTRTQQQAVTIVFIWIMVALTLSGYMVPISTLPPSLQYASALLPLRHYLTIVRGVMLKGSGLEQLWPHAVAIVALMVTAITVATRTLNRAIE